LDWSFPSSSFLHLVVHFPPSSSFEEEEVAPGDEGKANKHGGGELVDGRKMEWEWMVEDGTDIWTTFLREDGPWEWEWED
jgi:hypothetical protein